MKKWNFYTTNEIKPSGWLKRQFEIQAEGLNGNLDKVWRDIRDSKWIGGDAEGWERVPYWLDGFVPLAYLLENEDMINRAKKYIDAIINAQWENGWICPCTEEEIPTYDTWAILLITKVLKVYYDCSKDERIPKVIYKTLKNYYELLKCGTVKLFDWGMHRWYEGFIAIKFTYDIYKEDWLKDLAKILKEQGVNYHEKEKLWERPLNKWTLDTHIVNLVMMLKSEALYCDILGEEYTDKAEYFRTLLDKYNGTPVGLFTGDECLSGLSPIQGTELCAVAEQMFSYEILYAYTGDKKWVERLEVLAFNALPATISDDMWAHQYVQQSNQISCEKFPGKSVFRTNGPEAHLFGLEPHFGCCTSNFGQAWPKLTLSGFMYSDNTIISAVPIPSTVTCENYKISLETNYPFENELIYKVSADKDITLKIRVPQFAENLTVNGEKTNTENELSFDIKSGEEKEISVNFDTTPYIEKRPHGLSTVKCGSLVFSVPVKYEKIMHEYTRKDIERKFPYCDWEYVGKSKWNYALSDTSVKLIKKEISDIPFSSEKPPVCVLATVSEIDWGYADGYETVCAKVPESLEPIGEKEQLFLYPYGCAKLRMTEIPLI